MLDAFDRALIVFTQSGLPLVSDPYGAVGDIGATREEVMAPHGDKLAQGHPAASGSFPITTSSAYPPTA